MLVLVGLLVAVAATISAVSTLALRESLLEQVDDQVEESSVRALMAQERPPRGALDDDVAGGQAALDEPGGDRPAPPGLGAPGQAAGTVNLTIDDGVPIAGWIDEQGTHRELSPAQVAALSAVEPTANPVTVDLGELGRYRVLAVTAADGDRVVTGLSTGDATSTVQRFLVVELVIVALGVVLAALAGGALVRRQLRPLERVAATATRVSETPLHSGEVALAERVAAADTDPATEVGQVGLALNRLLGHVEGALAARHASETQVRQFVADASHELRTPLASIRGYAELVRRIPEDLPPTAVHALDRVESESRRMTTLVEDMLLLARLDAGRDLDAAPVDLAALAVDAVADAHVAGPGHVWRLSLPDVPDPDDAASTDSDSTSTVVLGDEDRLRQILSNLLVNARVHTPAGTTVTTTVRRHAGTVQLEVTDDGPGIPNELQPHLFHRFSRGDAARSPGSGSTGLGLAIVDAIVRSHGGSVAVESRPGATTFTVHLPAVAESARTPA
ncbi:sensor histidine kinase [Cellulomonas sp. 179-A 4D5 NHS]|uniref:sensor histidine kinase n=1 Tax=Cellulomonas sp. 179-A 4D5 NHS TaxID=3142378 RepID=UPI00399F7DBF